MEIIPIQVWHDGQLVNANKIIVQIIYDDLREFAKLYWVLACVEDAQTSEEGITSIEKQITYGNIDIEGEDYANWDGNNLYPFQLVASKLNVTLIAE